MIGTIQNNIQLQFSYNVYFSKDIFHAENLDLINTIQEVDSKEESSVCIFIDQGVLESHRGLIDRILHYFKIHHTKLKLLGNPMSIPGGEVCKTDAGVLDGIYRKFHLDRVDRHTFVLVIGGGAVLDSVGYAAATAHRGIRLLRIPTTILAQNDAGIGVKTGVNRYGMKNFIGAFAIPSAVINDVTFLGTLSDRDKRSGMAEAIKAALIRDGAFFEWMETNAENLTRFVDEAVQYMIRRCAELHLLQITKGGDPFETGSSRPLDFGHWAAHKLETMTGYELKHGEAVAIGMAIDTRYSLDTNRITKSDYERVISLIGGLGFKLSHPIMKQRDKSGSLTLLDGIDEFREHLGGESSITVLDSIGSSTEIHDVCKNTMERTITSLMSEVE